MGRSRKANDLYSTTVDLDKLEIGNKIRGWKTGANEAYVGTGKPELLEDDSSSTGPDQTTPYEDSRFVIVMQIAQVEAISPL